VSNSALIDDPRARKIFWKCRRGMLELDLVFTKFFQEKFSQLSDDEKILFDELLDEFDPILADWIFGAAPFNPRFTKIIAQLKPAHG
jgi:antitoxin CptB